MKRLLGAGIGLLIGTVAGGWVWHAASRPAHLGPHGDNIMVVTSLTAILGYAAAFILFASWRGSNFPKMVTHVNPGANEETLRLGLKAGVYGLHPGASYRVIREIKDHHGGIFAVGEELIFVQRHYLPYHGGHTVVFRPRPMYLQDETNADVLDHLATYLEESTEAQRGTAAWRGY